MSSNQNTNTNNSFCKDEFQAEILFATSLEKVTRRLYIIVTIGATIALCNTVFSIT